MTKTEIKHQLAKANALIKQAEDALKLAYSFCPDSMSLMPVDRVLVDIEQYQKEKTK